MFLVQKRISHKKKIPLSIFFPGLYGSQGVHSPHSLICNTMESIR